MKQKENYLKTQLNSFVLFSSVFVPEFPPCHLQFGAVLDAAFKQPFVEQGCYKIMRLFVAL